MRKNFVRLVALAVALCILPVTPAFAANISESVTTEQMQKEVQSLVQAKLNQVSHNFDGLDSGYLEAYTNYLVDYYTLAVASQTDASTRHTSQRLNNGGTAKYTTTDASGDYFDVVIIMLDKEDSYNYLLENWSPGSYTVGDAIITALGYVPVVGEAFGTVYSIVDGIIGLSTQTDWEKIQNADGYIMIETVVARGYPGSGASVLMGWDDHPYYIPYSSIPSSISILVEEFPA